MRRQEKFKEDFAPADYQGDHTLGMEPEFGLGRLGGRPNPNSGWESFPRPARCSELIRQAGTSWLWTGYLRGQEITLLSALWKAGKTMLLAHLLKAMETGGEFCGQTVQKALVLYIAEESGGRWAARRDDLKLADNTTFLIRPFKGKPTFAAWLGFLDYVAAILKAWPADLVVMDTISNLWPVRNENDAAEVQAAIMPLHNLTPRAALLLVHHLSKGGGQEATGSRGSGALPAFADTLIELRRFDKECREDRRRVLTGYGRWDDTPAEVVVELNEDGTGYAPLGDTESERRNAIEDLIAEVLPQEEPGMSYEEFIPAYSVIRPGAATPAKTKILAAFASGLKSERFNRSGAGKKNDPFRYWNKVLF